MNTLAESVAHFCDLRCTLGLAHASARWRRTPGIAPVLGVVHKIVRGSGALENIEPFAEIAGRDLISLTFARMSEISRNDLMRRAIILFSTEHEGKLAHFATQIERIWMSGDIGDKAYIETMYAMHARNFASMMRGITPDHCVESFKHDAWKINLYMALNGVANSARYKMLDEYFAERPETYDAIATIARIIMYASTTREASHIADCIANGNKEDLRECMPQMGNATLEFLTGPHHESIELHMIMTDRAPKFAIGPSYARDLARHGKYGPVFEQCAIDSPMFAEHLAILRRLRDTELSGPNEPYITMDVIAGAIVHAARNPDARAFELVYEIVAGLREFCRVCNIIIADDDECDVMLREILRLESKGMIVSLEAYLTQSHRYGRLPRFANIAQFMDIVLSRCVSAVIRGKQSFQNAAVQFLARVLYAFGSHVSAVFDRHFASYPSMLARIRAHALEFMNDK